MTDSEELQEALTRALQKSGRKAVKDALLALEIGADDDATYLTIVGNGGCMQSRRAAFMESSIRLREARWTCPKLTR